MKVDNFVSNRLKNYIWYISVKTRPPQVCIPSYALVNEAIKGNEKVTDVINSHVTLLKGNKVSKKSLCVIMYSNI